MVQKERKRVLRQIIFRCFRSIDESGISFSRFIKLIIQIINFSQFLVGSNTRRINALQLFQFLYGKLWTGSLIHISEFQIGLFIIRIEIDSLFVKLTSFSGIFLSYGYIALQHRYRSRFAVSLLSKSGISFRFTNFTSFQICLTNSSQKIGIFFIFPFQQLCGFFGSLRRVGLNQFFYFGNLAVPISIRRLRKKRTGCYKCSY